MQHLIDQIAFYFATYLILPLLGVGVYLTIRMGFVQLRRFGHSWRVITGVYDDPTDPGDISHMQALATALSATIGIGNIAGVATAIHFGGPGALFWMWVTAALGMTTKFTEVTLALAHRKEHRDGSISGGPMYYIEKGLGGKWKPMAILFAAAAVVSSFGTGNSIQSFTAADSLHTDFGIEHWLTGLVIATLVGLVILGGIRRIGVVASVLVPFMCIIYVAGCSIVIFDHASQIPAALGLIFKGAFTPQGAVGGFAGSTFYLAILWGVRRGVYSNEAGQGSAPIAHAAAKTYEPVREGAVAMIEPFLDTLVICTLTGLCIVVTGVWTEPVPRVLGVADPVIVMAGTELQPGGKVGSGDWFNGELVVRNGEIEGAERQVYREGFVETPRYLLTDLNGISAPVEYGRLKVVNGRVTGFENELGDNLLLSAHLEGAVLQNGSPLTAQAFATTMGRFGSWIVTFGVLLFAVSTIISWSYYGDRAVVYLFGQRGVRPYRWVYVIIVFVAAQAELAVVWGFGDIALSIMATPNLIALILLAPEVKAMKDDYYSRKHVPEFKPHF